MKNIELKIYSSIHGATTLKEFKAQLDKKLNAPLEGHSLSITESIRKQVTKYLKETYECELRDGVQSGCYGSRDGSRSEGLTVWMHPKHVTDRYIDSEHGECVNPWFLLEEHGTLLQDVEGEQFLEIIDAAGVDYKSDNTYNFNGNCSEDALFIFDFQFDHVVINEVHFLVCMFHCGGDPRGNYTSKSVWKFKYEDDIFSVIAPSKFESDDQE